MKSLAISCAALCAFCAALCALALPGCSALFDGSKYRGGAGSDGGIDTGDGGGGTDSGPVLCSDDPSVCPTGSVCIDDVCEPCDDDDDGYVSDAARCDPLATSAPRDCDDSDPEIHPFAVPICGNGIDESCTGGSIAGGLATEAGLFDDLLVTVPPGVDRPSRLHVFSRPDARAFVFFSAGNSERTPYVADVALGGADTSPTALGTAMGMGLPTSMLRSDAVWADGTHVLAAAMASGSSGTMVFGLYDLVAGTWSGVATTGFTLDGAGGSGFTPIGPAALVVRGSSYFFAVPATTTASTMPTMYALGVNSAHFQAIGLPGEVQRVRPWVESAGPAVAYPDAAGNVRFWAGSTSGGGDETRQANTAPLPVGAGAGAIVAVRGSGDLYNMLAFAVPSPTSVAAFTTVCSDAMATLDACPSFVPGVSSPNEYAAMIGTDPRIAVSRVSSTAVAIVQPTTNGGTSLSLAALETNPLGEAPLRLPVRIDVDGDVVGVAVDTSLEDTADGGTLTYSVAYIVERGGGTTRELHVLGARSCFGSGV